MVLIITLRPGLAPLLGLRRRDNIITRSPEELARRVRLALEDAGGMFLKLGQLLATRPDILSPAALAELDVCTPAPLPSPETPSRS